MYSKAYLLTYWLTHCAVVIVIDIFKVQRVTLTAELATVLLTFFCY